MYSAVSIGCRAVYCFTVSPIVHVTECSTITPVSHVQSSSTTELSEVKKCYAICSSPHHGRVAKNVCGPILLPDRGQNMIEDNMDSAESLYREKFTWKEIFYETAGIHQGSHMQLMYIADVIVPLMIPITGLIVTLNWTRNLIGLDLGPYEYLVHFSHSSRVYIGYYCLIN